MEESDPLVKPFPRGPRGSGTLTPSDPLAQIKIAGVPIAELFRATPSGDYRAHVQLMRALIAVSRDPETLSKFAADSLRAAERMHGPRMCIP